MSELLNLGFIGVGNIAVSLIKGLCTSKIENINISISPRGKEKSLFLKQTFPAITRMDSNQAVLDKCKYIFIALPPNISKDVLESLKFDSNHTVVSFVPLLQYEELKKIVMPAANVCRAVPFPTVEKHNCPVLLFNPDETVKKIFQFVGSPVILEKEVDLHILWSLTGLIAPFYDLCETLSNWAQSKGVHSPIAGKYVLKMFSSLSSSIKESSHLNFSELKREATTPGGMNENALKIIGDKKAKEAYWIAADIIYENFFSPGFKEMESSQSNPNKTENNEK